jgi:hypothetical protein
MGDPDRSGDFIKSLKLIHRRFNQHSRVFSISHMAEAKFFTRTKPA